MFAPCIWFSFRRHPSERLLISLHDGEISRWCRRRIERHLQKCSNCKERIARINRDWAYLSKLNGVVAPEVPENGLVESVHASIAVSADPAAMARRMEAVLEVYLGKRAAAALLKGERTDSAQDGIAKAESMLRILLGNRSAAAIESKLLRIRSSSIL